MNELAKRVKQKQKQKQKQPDRSIRRENFQSAKKIIRMHETNMKIMI